jgi:hypothetical protein
MLVLVMRNGQLLYCCELIADVRMVSICLHIDLKSWERLSKQK